MSLRLWRENGPASKGRRVQFYSMDVRHRDEFLRSQGYDSPGYLNTVGCSKHSYEVSARRNQRCCRRSVE